MKICGIICEYNPFHNGHLKHLEYTKRYSGCDYILCIMSGNFVQRGEAAILEKHIRAKHAVRAGADIVIELPAVFATSAADDFAYGAMKYITALKCECLSFGSECGDIEPLEKTAKILNVPNTKAELKVALKSGVSYPKAYAQAVKQCSMLSTQCSVEDGGLNEGGTRLLDAPNNLLALKYISCGTELGYSGEYITLKRAEGYNSEALDGLPSARAIRRGVNEGLALNTDMLPGYVLNDLSSFLPASDYERFIAAFTATLEARYIKALAGVSEGLENRIIRAQGAENYNKLIEEIKTKRYTLLRIKRILTAALLGLTKEVLQNAKAMTPYINILAVKKGSKEKLLSHIGRCNVAKDGHKFDSVQAKISSIDKKADKIYSALSGYRHDGGYLTEVE
jgi:predicted nucleotidyltransferase